MTDAWRQEGTRLGQEMTSRFAWWQQRFKQSNRIIHVQRYLRTQLCVLICESCPSPNRTMSLYWDSFKIMLGTVACFFQFLNSFLPMGLFNSPCLWSALNSSSTHSLGSTDPKKEKSQNCLFPWVQNTMLIYSWKVLLCVFLTFFPKIIPQLFVLKKYFAVQHVETHFGEIL